ncbi:unnamed protein product, partial [Rotaria socialis]
MGFLSATVEAQGVLTATFPQLLFLAFYCLSKLTARYTTTTVSLIFECNSSHTTSTSVPTIFLVFRHINCLIYYNNNYFT